jgi:hypothetical protein
MPDSRFGRVLETAPAEIPLVTILTAIRRDEEKMVKEEFHSPVPSGPVA